MSSWLPDDLREIEFVLELGEPTIVSTGSVSDKIDTTKVEQSESADPKAPFLNEKKTKNRRRRREEILNLRLQAEELEANLAQLKQHEESRTRVSKVIEWKAQARREASARRRSEMKHTWLLARLARHAKIVEVLLRKLEIAKNTQVEQESHSRVSKPTQDTTIERSTKPSVRIVDGVLPGVTVIEMEGTWCFDNHQTESVEAALWSMFQADRMAISELSVDYEIVTSEETSVQSSFMIYSNDGFVFKGSQLARSMRDESTGGFVVACMAQTLPHSGRCSEIFVDATMLEEESNFHVRKSSSRFVEVAIERQFHLHAIGVNATERRQLAQSVAVYLKEEMEWMRDEVEQRGGMEGQRDSWSSWRRDQEPAFVK